MTRAEFIQHFPLASEEVIKLSCDPDPEPVQFIAAGPQAEDEAELREEIRKEIASRGWLVLCGTTAARTGRTLGEPDLLVFADRGRVFPVELKTRAGKLSLDQQGVHAHLRKLGHQPLVVRSIEEFREAVKI